MKALRTLTKHDESDLPLKHKRSRHSVVSKKKPLSLFLTPSLARRVSNAILKVRSYYMNHQHPDGYWWYELESNVTITAEYLMLLHFLGLKDEERDRKITSYILRNQRNDGTWPIHWGGKGDLSTTVEAYFALKLAGFSSDDYRLLKAKEFILSQGGVESSRLFTKIFLALFGEFSWIAIPSIPVELNLLPPWLPVNIYSLSSWARATFVPLSIIADIKPERHLLGKSGIRELYANPDTSPPVMPKKHALLSVQTVFAVLDKVLKMLEQFPIRPFRDRALRKTERWILDHQEHTGDWGGIQPAMVNSLLALAARGYDVSQEPVKKGLEALKRFTIESSEEIRLQACISPIWDTALTSLALVESGIERDHPSILKSCSWLASKQIFKKGDWSIKRPELKPGGWAFEFENSWYPDVDDTSVVLMLLHGYDDTEFINTGNFDRGIQWILGMQGKDGGWGSFDADNNLELLNRLPHGDLEAMIDPSTADITGRVLELLGMRGYTLSDDPVQRALKFIKKNQEKDGTWWGRWGVNYIYGTCAVLAGLSSVGEDMSASYIKKAVTWLKSHQNTDGGWGECCEAYEDSSLKCHGASTPSQTAWAILALIASKEATSKAVSKGIKYLLDCQKEDGTWDEEEFTGTGFPKYFMIRYHNYCNCFPLMALGRFFSHLVRKGNV